MLQLDFEMSQGLLPLDGAPPSAVILRQFPLQMELCFDEAAKNSEALWSVRWLAMFDCLREGLHAFQTESFDGIEIDEAWTNYFDLNQDRVQNYRYQLESAPIWMDEDSDSVPSGVSTIWSQYHLESAPTSVNTMLWRSKFSGD